MSLTPHQAAAHVAVAVRVDDPEREVVARRNLAEAKIAEAIERSVAAAPPLTPAQIKRLSGLLRSGKR
ncbi:hypothetical protein JS515_04170 [Clavibacter sp. DM3]|nr:hypothetical protein [Clavibacter zhangzhiyongii]